MRTKPWRYHTSSIEIGKEMNKDGQFKTVVGYTMWKYFFLKIGYLSRLIVI